MSKLDKLVSFRFSQDEYTQLVEAAQEMGETVSVYLRHTVLLRLGASLPATATPPSEVVQLLSRIAHGVETLVKAMRHEEVV